MNGIGLRPIHKRACNFEPGAGSVMFVLVSPTDGGVLVLVVTMIILLGQGVGFPFLPSLQGHKPRSSPDKTVYPTSGGVCPVSRHQESEMRSERIPIDVAAAAVLGALLGALWVVFEGSTGDAVADIATGGIAFGSLGAVRWLNRLGSRDTRDPLI
ncbi:MAG TPA: hypothetical protein VHL52_00485 [Acidimicrobiia bacterium]|nr:hypothetical protein [Acidimicrobiia bacterium]